MPISVFLFLVNLSLIAHGFEHITTSHGLSSERTFSIAEGQDGFMWFATKLGIDRYDGKQIKHYNLVDDDSISNEQISVNKLVTDADGYLWAFNRIGIIYRYSALHDRFEKIVDMRTYLHRSRINVNSVYVDNRLGLLIVTDIGMFLFVPNGNDSFTNTRITYNIAYNITPFGDDFILLASDGIHLFKRTGNGLALFDNPVIHSIKDLVAQSIYIDQEDSIIWIGTSNSGLFSVSYGSKSPVVTKIQGFKKSPIRSIKKIDNLRLIVGTDGLGVYIINKNTLLIEEHFKYEEDEPCSLGGNGVYDMHVDSFKRRWIASYTGGISVYDPHKPKFNNIIHKIGNSNSLVNNHVNAVFEDSRGNSWYATDDGISLYESKQNKWSHFMNKAKEEELGSSVFLTLCEDNLGRIWTGGYSVGAFSIDLDTHTVSQYLKDDNNINSLGTNDIYTIIKDSSGNLWFSGNLSCFNVETNSFTRYSIKNVNTIIEKNKNELFLGTTAGLLVFEKQTGETAPVIIPELKMAKYKDLVIRCFCCIGDILWIGTDGDGLIAFNYIQEKAVVYNTKDGLTSDYIYGIVPDSLNRLWVSTERGINCLHTDLGEIDIYDISDGLPSSEFISNSFCRKRDGTIFFGTPNGVVSFRPEDFSTRKEIKNGILRFTDFVVNNTSILSNKEYNILSQPLDSTDVIRLRYYQNFFSIEFTEIDFSTSEQILYSYQLENIDDKWSIPSKERKAHYTNVPPGKYLFRVKTFIAGKERSNREITILIVEPWWNNTWSKLFYLLMLMILCWFIYRFFRQHIDKMQNKEKINFFIATAHDIRTPITLIKSPLNDIECDENLSEKSRMYLNLALNNINKLTRFVDQLLDFQKSDLNQMKLVLSKQNVTTFIEERVQNYRVLAMHKNITFTVFLPDNDHYLYFDSDKIDRVIDNLLSNAFKYTPAYGNVSVRVVVDTKSWSIEVRDTGIGVPKNSVNKLFRQFYRADNAVNSKENGSGIGLLLTKNLVKLHNGTISFKNNLPNGSVFTVAFPRMKFEFSDLVEAERVIMQDPEVCPVSENNHARSKLMIVEDNDELRNYLAQSFSDKYRICQYSDGLQALSAIRKIQPDIVISDIMMPNMTGDKLCEKIKGNIETSHIPVVLLTALDGRNSMVSGLATGADDYISKPFDIVVLKSKVNSILINRKKLRERYISESVSDKLQEYNTQMDRDFIEKATAYITENIENENLTINEICQNMAMSRTLFYNKLTALTGQSPNEFIRVIRLKHAAELLKSRQYNVGGVAVKVGIPDTKYFSKLFKLFFGVSPKDYAKKVTE